jgi:hypothetical protein
LLWNNVLVKFCINFNLSQLLEKETTFEELRNESIHRIAYYANNSDIQEKRLQQQAREFDEQYENINDKVVDLTKSCSNLAKENMKLLCEKDKNEKSLIFTNDLDEEVQYRQVCPNKGKCNGVGNKNNKFNNHRSLNSCPLNQVILYMV